MIAPPPGPRVSAIVVTHNRPNFLFAAVSSVLRQTLGSIEVVIVDDGSTDDTPAVAAHLAALDPRVRVVHQPNSGLPAARNAGLAHATAEWVAFLDDDDLWVPEALEELLVGAPSGCDAVACHALRFSAVDPGVAVADVLADPDAFAVGPWPPIPPVGEITLREILLRPVAPIHAALFRREVVQQIGGFDSSLAASEDYDLWLRVALRGPVPVIPRALALYRWHAGQMSSMLRPQVAETRRALERFLAGHRRAIPASDRWLLRRRLASLAREEAYAALLDGDGRGARGAAVRALLLVPVAFKAWLYLVASLSPNLYRSLRRRWRGGEGESRVDAA
jgi:glycosyltransferase involved in cell wall biosynthesis